MLPDKPPVWTVEPVLWQRNARLCQHPLAACRARIKLQHSMELFSIIMHVNTDDACNYIAVS